MTSYARSNRSSASMPTALAALKETGLSRIHIGMESGADEVLKLV